MKNKLHIGVILSMIFLYANTFGQGVESEKSKDEIVTAKTYLDLMVNGVSTTFNYGNSNSALKDYKNSVKGTQIGLSFQAGITPKFSLVSELYFMMKGGKLTAGNPLTTAETTLRFYSIEVPILARFHLGKFYMNAGPSIAYNFHGTRKVDEQLTKFSFAKESEGFKRFDAGIQLGGGYAFQLKQKRLALDIRYNYGLTNVSYKDQLYNRGLVVSIQFSKAWKTNPLRKYTNLSN